MTAVLAIIPPGRIHRAYCPSCPSAPGKPSDPEAEDIQTSVEAGEVDPLVAAFPCAWRPKALCLGICESLGVVDARELSWLGPVAPYVAGLMAAAAAAGAP